jgi:hypothetical protein
MIMQSTSHRSFVIIGDSPDLMVQASRQLRQVFPQAPIASFHSTAHARDYIEASSPDAIIDAFVLTPPEEAPLLQALQREYARVQVCLPLALPAQDSVLPSKATGAGLAA